MNHPRKLVINKKKYNDQDEQTRRDKIVSLINQDPTINYINLSRMKLCTVFRLDRMTCFTNVIRLILSRNKLNTSPSVSRMTNLKYLDLSHNNLTEFPYRLPPSLQYLSLKSNNIKELSKYQSVYHQMKELNINDNLFQVIPPETSKMFPNLEYFWCSKNKLTMFPYVIFNLTKLVQFFIDTTWHNTSSTYFTFPIIGNNFIMPHSIDLQYNFSAMPNLKVLTLICSPYISAFRVTSKNFSNNALKKICVGTTFQNIQLEFDQGKLTSITADNFQLAIDFGVKDMDLSQLKLIKTRTSPENVINMLSTRFIDEARLGINEEKLKKLINVSSINNKG